MGKRFRAAAVVAAMLVLTATLAKADRNYSGDFLSIGVGARALGMGGAFVAVADDATSAYWNPAGLSFIPNIEVTTIHLNPNALQSYDFVNYAQFLEDIGTFSLSYIRLGADQIPLTDASGPTIKAYFADSENAVLLSGGARIFRGV